MNSKDAPKSSNRVLFVSLAEVGKEIMSHPVSLPEIEIFIEIHQSSPGRYQLLDGGRPWGEPKSFSQCMADLHRVRVIRSRHRAWQATVELLKSAMAPLVGDMLGLPVDDQEVVNHAYQLAIEAAKVSGPVIQGAKL